MLKHHSFSASEKFILEIFWRGYFKGWLANRPSVWNEFVQYHHANAGKAGTDTESYRRAISGETGISCFDSWVDELKTSYYLHNHARMWFASIWIFTLGLDWQSGAAFLPAICVISALPPIRLAGAGWPVYILKANIIWRQQRILPDAQITDLTLLASLMKLLCRYLVRHIRQPILAILKLRWSRHPICCWPQQKIAIWKVWHWPVRRRRLSACPPLWEIAAG